MIRNILLGSLYEKIGNKEKAEEQFRQAAAYLGVKKVNYRYP
jgi:Flp pilus assembly protein TadD